MSTVRFNTDNELVYTVRNAIVENGGYCPCKLDKTPDTKCICREFREFVKAGNTGLCHCGLYEAV